MIRFSITKGRIAEILGLAASDPDREYRGICTLEAAEDQTVLFIKQVKKEQAATLRSLQNCLIITADCGAADLDCLIVSDTRLAMAKVLNHIRTRLEDRTPGICPTAHVHPGAKIGQNVRIESFAFIDDRVEIGDHTLIKQGARIMGNSIIGAHAIIRENAVVGSEGMGVVKDENGNNLRIAHLGGVRVGDHVEMGALATIQAGTIEPTVLADYVIISDHVHIPHNSKIGRNTMIGAGSVLSGSTTVGANVWIGPNSTVINGVSICDDTFIGIGTLITKNITEPHQTYAGVPGQELNQYLRDRRALHFMGDHLAEIEKLLDQ